MTGSPAELAEIIKLLRAQSVQIGKLMSAISDFAAKVDANFTAIQAGITNLDAQIQSLDAALATAGSLSPADQALLDGVVAQSAALATAAAAPVTPPAPATP